MSDKEKLEPPRRGFSHHATDEQIRAYLQLPPSERLRWLEEAREFMFEALSEKEWETLQRFRKGEL